MPKSSLEWTNITRADCDSVAQEAWDKFVHAKQELECALEMEAQARGVAQEGDTFKFAYNRWAQGSIGMAIAERAPQARTGFGGLKRPEPKQSLQEFMRDRDIAGYRR